MNDIGMQKMISCSVTILELCYFHRGKIFNFYLNIFPVQ